MKENVANKSSKLLKSLIIPPSFDMPEEAKKERKPYRKLWQRDTQNPPAFELQGRDRELIEIVWQLRHANSDQIAELFLLGHPSDPEMKKSYSVRGVKNRLFKLFHHGFLSHPPKREWLALRALNGRNLPAVYSIGSQSKQLLAERGYDPAQIKAALKQCTYRYLQHALGVTDFHAALIEAISYQSAWSLVFSKHEGKETRASWKITDERASRRLRKDRYVINPDKYFCLDGPDPTAVGGQAKMWLFLEFDTGSVSFARWRWKIDSYTQLLRERRNMGSPFGMEKVKKEREINGRKQIVERYPTFKVVTITTTPQRQEALRRIAIQADPRGQGLRIFWFGVAQEYKTDHRRVLEPIFYLPSGDESYSLLQRQFQ